MKKTLQQQRYEFTRQAIIKTAREIIATDGAKGLTARKLADAVGYSPANIYKYFENMDEVLDAVRQEGWQQYATMQAEIDLEGLSPLEHLIELGHVLQRFAEQYPQHYLLMHASADAPALSTEDLLADEGHRGLVSLVERIVASGELKLRGYTPTQLALHIWFLSHGIAMLKITLMREDERFKELSEGVLMAFVNSLRA